MSKVHTAVENCDWTSVRTELEFDNADHKPKWIFTVYWACPCGEIRRASKTFYAEDL